jgi:flagellar L-ring protein FlgH
MKFISKPLYILTAILLVIGFTSGCATMDRFFGPPTDVKIPRTPVAGQNIDEETGSEVEPDRYSQNTQLIPAVDRHYKRMTKARMEEESDLQAGAGSLWVMEGQKSFLFAQNNKRREGDPTSLKVEGPAMKQVQLKINTIQDLLNDLEEQRRQAELDQKKQEAEKKRLADVEIEKQKILDGDNAPEEKVAQEQAEKIVKERKPAAVEASKTAKVEKEVKVDLKEIEMIPSKIVEKVDGGLYRVSGFQTLTIKNRPYKVIATGLIRTDDFSDGQISSNKLVDPQFDVIHMKKDDRAKLSEEGVIQ